MSSAKIFKVNRVLSDKSFMFIKNISDAIKNISELSTDPLGIPDFTSSQVEV